MPLIKKYRDREIKLKELLHEFHEIIEKLQKRRNCGDH